VGAQNLSIAEQLRLLCWPLYAELALAHNLVFLFLLKSVLVLVSLTDAKLKTVCVCGAIRKRLSRINCALWDIREGGFLLTFPPSRDLSIFISGTSFCRIPISQ